MNLTRRSWLTLIPGALLFTPKAQSPLEELTQAAEAYMAYLHRSGVPTGRTLSVGFKDGRSVVVRWI